MVVPPPADDLKAIQLFLTNRDEELFSVSKLWFGPYFEPDRNFEMSFGHRGAMRRAYRVIGRTKDGSKSMYKLAEDNKDSLGNVKLAQNSHGVWLPVSQ